MLQMYTIFKNDIVILLTDTIKNVMNSDFYYWDKIDFKLLIKSVELEGKLKLVLYHPDLERLWEEFQANFMVIEAAGGLVQNNNKEILFIFRHQKWDLPKGKVEKDEPVEIAAIREVQEECGLQVVTLDSFLEKTYHIYTENNQEILKISHWFLMFSDEKKLIPQQEEGISVVLWKNKQAIEKALQNTFPNIKLLSEKVLKTLT
jgi:ADP-ribose pyrophosphatase YjhB (NUDIX family)